MTDRPNLLRIKPGQAEIMEYCEPEEASDPYATYRRANLMAGLPLFVVILVLLNVVFPLPAHPWLGLCLQVSWFWAAAFPYRCRLWRCLSRPAAFWRVVRHYPAFCATLARIIRCLKILPDGSPTNPKE